MSEETARPIVLSPEQRAAIAEEVAGLVGAALGVDVEVDGDEVVLEGCARVKLPLPPR